MNVPGNVLKESEHKLMKVKWIHHAGFAYIPDELADIDLCLNTVTSEGIPLNI